MTGHHHSPAYDHDTEAVLRRLLLVELPPLDDPAKVEKALTDARQHGVTAEHCAAMRSAWEKDRARRVVVWHADGAA